MQQKVSLPAVSDADTGLPRPLSRAITEDNLHSEAVQSASTRGKHMPSTGQQLMTPAVATAQTAGPTSRVKMGTP